MKDYIYLIYFYCAFFCFQIIETADDNSYILCSESFCEEYIKKNPCPKIPENCNIQNDTHNGLFIPFDGPCNCCKYCLENLAKGSTCILGSPDGPIPDIICGDGLYCDKVTNKCIDKLTPCIIEQLQYDDAKEKGKLWQMQLRPECDKRGDYMPMKCVPGEICFCVNKQGFRLFGEMPYNDVANGIATCECSRIIDDINEVLGITEYTQQRPKCVTNGNYNSIQCLKSGCICVDPYSGSPVDPKPKTININLISELPCFDPNIHPNGTYFENCDKQYNKIVAEIETYKLKGYDEIVGLDLPECQLDGKYAPVQKQGDYIYCANPEGELLENFKIQRNNPLADGMNCNCARARIVIPFDKKPKCCANGNYACIQCHQGKCRCVDTDGIQVAQEVDISEVNQLKCKNCDSTCTKYLV